MNHRNLCVALMSMQLTSPWANAQQPVASEVKFADIFSSGALGADVVISIPDSQSLVISGAGPYRLESRNLILRAKNVRVDGVVTIESYSPDNTAAATDGTPATPPQVATLNATGTTGTMGSQGRSGDSGGSYVLDVEKISFVNGGALIVSARGQTGGQGQIGGAGGQGGAGSSGTKATSDFPMCSDPCPGIGHKGGQGGGRGPGGIGGTGGAGGTIYLSSTLKALLDASAVSFKVDVSGGPAGKPGPIGTRGVGGGGGARGEGGNCHCSNPPGPGPDGDLGADTATPTPDGVSGAVGSVQPL